MKQPPKALATCSNQAMLHSAYCLPAKRREELATNNNTPTWENPVINEGKKKNIIK